VPSTAALLASKQEAINHASVYVADTEFVKARSVCHLPAPVASYMTTSRTYNAAIQMLFIHFSASVT